MRQDVWVEPRSVSLQIDQVVKYQVGKLEKVTKTVLFQSRQVVTA
jgi:hypothetical protein